MEAHVTRSALAIILMISSSLSMAGSSWEIKVQYPDKEVKTYSIGDALADIPVGKFQWKCTAGPVTLTDDSGIKGAQRNISCTKGKDFVETSGKCAGDGVDILSKLSSMPNWMRVDSGKDWRYLTFSCRVY
jgi:hypothetical protein